MIFLPLRNFIPKDEIEMFNLIEYEVSSIGKIKYENWN